LYRKAFRRTLWLPGRDTNSTGLAQLARDREEVQVAFQLLIYPMIEGRNVTPASYAITDPRMWNRESNRLGWNAPFRGVRQKSPY
jgi:acetyl esterase/lipase